MNIHQCGFFPTLCLNYQMNVEICILVDVRWSYRSILSNLIPIVTELSPIPAGVIESSCFCGFNNSRRIKGFVTIIFLLLLTLNHFCNLTNLLLKCITYFTHMVDSASRKHVQCMDVFLLINIRSWF